MSTRIQGRVLETPSGSGLRGVVVSNGEHVVRTDGDGRYTIEVEPPAHRFVFVTVPDGFRSHTNFYRSILDWTDVQEGVDFIVVPAPERASRTFSLVQITDTHIEEAPSYKTPIDVWPGELLHLVQEADPDLIVSSGDQTDWGTLFELNRFCEAIQMLSIPLFPSFGWHDGLEVQWAAALPEEFSQLDSISNIAERAARRAKIINTARQAPDRAEIRNRMDGHTLTWNYEQVFGPAYYSFDWGGRHFVFYPNEKPCFSPADRQRKESWFWADLGAQPEDREIVVVVHTPPSSAFLERLRDTHVRLVLHGDYHSSRIFSYGKIIVAGTPPLCFGGIDTSPRGYLLVRFQEDHPELEVKPLHRTGVESSSKEIPMEILLDGADQKLRLRWEHQLPAGLHRAAPVCLREQLLLSLRDEKYPGRSGVYCIDSRSGEFRWHTPTDASIKNSVAATLRHEAEGAERLCAAASVTGRVYVLETMSGRILWQADLPGYPDRWVYSSPVIADRTVYVGDRAGYTAYDLETGEQRWNRPLELPLASNGNLPWSCYASPLVYEDMVLVFVPRSRLMALNQQDGSVVWEQEVGGFVRHHSPVLAAAGDLLVSGGLSRTPEDLVVLQARTGAIVWHRPVLSVTSPPTGLTVREDRIYVTTSNGEARCYDLQSGDLFWRFQTGGDLMDMIPYERDIRSILAPPVFWRGRILICGCDGCVYVLDAVSGECKGRTSFGSPVTVAPCLVEEGVCIGTYDGRVCCFGA